MKRRKFVAAAGIGAAMSSCATAATVAGVNNSDAPAERAIIEWRSYEMKWGHSSKMFMSYLKDMLKPAMLKAGASSYVIYKETTPQTPTNIHVQIAHPNMAAYARSLDISTSEEFMMATKEYDAQESSAFNRLTTSLFHAYTGMPQVVDAMEGSNLFELRIYEGYNEDAVRRKNKMFNVEEIELFADLGFHAIFYSEAIAGPYMPCMVYMLNYKDQDDRKAKWDTFIQSPRWKTMVAKPEYAKTVSNIRNIFLEVV